MDEQFTPPNDAGAADWAPDTWAPDVAEDTAVHPPVPAAELPSADEKPVPFWKKEISFGRRDKTNSERPANQKAEKRAKNAEQKAEKNAEKKAAQAQKKAEKAHQKATKADAKAAKKAEQTATRAEQKATSTDARAAKKAEQKATRAELKAAKQAEKNVQPKTRRKVEKKVRKKPEKRGKAPKLKADRAGRTPKKLVGLKIGASQLAAACVSNNGAAELVQVAREPLDPGIVVGGELRDPDALVQALRDFFRRNRLPRRGVRLGIANNRIGVRTFDVVGIDDPKQLANAIKYRAQEALPIPIDEAVLDYQILSEYVDEDGKAARRVLLVVAYREQIDRYVDACKKADIALAGIDLEAFALLRALQAPQEGAGDDPTAALVAVTLGHDRSTFAVSDGRICEFTRVLDWGGATLNVVIARALEAAPSEVEAVKRALSLHDESVPAGLTPEQAEKARTAVRSTIQSFARELVSSLQYYQNQPGSLGIGEIVLTGGTAHLPGLATELERLIGVRVQVGDPLARMKVSKKVREPEQLGSFAVAIGLGIED